MSQPGDVIADYEVVASLGRGGMGEVLLARRRRAHGFERLFAIKTIRADLDADQSLRDMFLDEARLMALLTHPAIAQVVDFGDGPQGLYLVMEYIAGVALKELYAARLPLPPGIACRLLAEACRGLHAAHELCDRDGRALEVVHRDVSPQNLMLTFDGRVKILDFGVARMTDRVTPNTTNGAIKGKPGYMAPEQLDGQIVDRRTDVFAASAVLHELLTGRRLFVRDTLSATTAAILHGVIPPPSAAQPELSPLLDALVLSGLERDRERRIATALQLAMELEQMAQLWPEQTLEGYAAEALAPERAAELLRLQASPAAVQSDRAVPSGVDRVTRPAALRHPEDAATIAEGLAPAAPSPGPAWADVTETPTADSLKPRRTRRRAVTLGAALALLGIAGAFVVARRPPAVLDEAPAPSGAAAASSNRTAEVSPAPPAGASRPPEAAPEPARPPGPAPAAARRKLAPRGPPPRRAPGEAQAVAPGLLSVAAQPYAHVRLDGVIVGNTPLLRLPVSAGSHVVEFLDPETGAVRQRDVVRLGPDEHAQIKGR